MGCRSSKNKNEDPPEDEVDGIPEASEPRFGPDDSNGMVNFDEPEHPLSPKANLTQSAIASASAEQARADGQGQLVDVADPTSPLSPTTTSPAAGTPLGGTSPTPNPSASLPPPTVESLTAEKQRLEAELDRATSTHFVDNIVGRSLTGGIFTAVLTSQVEESLHQKIESHVAEASEAAVAAIAPGVSAEDHDELRRQVEAHNAERAALEEKVRVLHQRLDEHGPQHEGHAERHAELAERHSVLRSEHDALKEQVGQLVANKAGLAGLDGESDSDGSAATIAAAAAAAAAAAREENERLSLAVKEHEAARERHAQELAAAEAARVTMEAQLNAMHAKVEQLVTALMDHTAAREADAKRHDEHTSGIKTLDTSLQTLQEQLAASAESSKLKAKLAERKANRLSMESAAVGGDSPSWTTVKEKLYERRKAKEEEQARLAREAAKAEAEAEAAAAAAEAAAQPAKPRRQSAVSALVPNPKWDEELIKKHPMEGLAKFLKTNHFRVVDLFNSMDRNKDNMLTYDEVFQALIDLQIPLPDSGVTQLCHELDRNGDGNITYKELKRCEQSYVAHSREIRKSEIAQQKNHPSRRYSITSGRKH